MATAHRGDRLTLGPERCRSTCHPRARCRSCCRPRLLAPPRPPSRQPQPGHHLQLSALRLRWQSLGRTRKRPQLWHRCRPGSTPTSTRPGRATVAHDGPRLLNPELLDELEFRWREQGAFVANALRPGLSDDDIDRLTEPAGLTLPLEARRWWGWHDGADPQIPGIAAELGPAKAFLSLAEASGSAINGAA